MTGFLAAKITQLFKLRCGNLVFFPLSAPKFDDLWGKYKTQVRKLSFFVTFRT